MIPKLQAVYTFLTRLSKREKAVFYAAVCAVSVVLLDQLVIYPVYTKMKSLNSQTKEREAAIRRDLHILAQKDRIASEAKKYSSFAGAGQSQDEDITLLLKEIETLANKSALYIIDMKPGAVKEDTDGTRRYQVSLNCEGQMEQIMDFIYNIENSSILLVVDRYQITPKSKESSIAKCSIGVSKVVIP